MRIALCISFTNPKYWGNSKDVGHVHESKEKHFIRSHDCLWRRIKINQRCPEI